MPITQSQYESMKAYVRKYKQKEIDEYSQIACRCFLLFARSKCGVTDAQALNDAINLMTVEQRDQLISKLSKRVSGKA